MPGSPWTLHWLEAEGDLGAWRDTVRTAAIEAERAVARLFTPPALDILVERNPHVVIPEWGIGARALRPTLCAIAIDPDNPNFADAVAGGALARTCVHELHHCLRIAATGYGATLGEALVMEGLAGRFVSQLFGTGPELWERAVDDDTLEAHRPDREQMSATPYDHAAWFFGRGGERPRWLGYTLGYRIVGDWLATLRAAPDVAAWFQTPATAILEAIPSR